MPNLADSYFFKARPTNYKVEDYQNILGESLLGGGDLCSSADECVGLFECCLGNYFGYNPTTDKKISGYQYTCDVTSSFSC